MKLSKSINMKEILAHSLYILMQEKSFDKITIKQIAEKAGVIRGTFYNHFYDKYEAHEYLTYLILFEKNVNISSIRENNSIFILNIFSNIEENKDFFRKSFKIDGQNNFENVLNKMFISIIEELIETQNLDITKLEIDKDYFVNSLANSIVFQIKFWNDHQFKYSSEEMKDMFYKYHTNSTLDILKSLY